MVFLVGLQPIIANARPPELDSYIFAAMTCIIESIIFFPIMMIERRSFKISKEINPEKISEHNSLLNGWKNQKTLIIFIGINFAIAQILFFLGLELAGAINGSIAVKTAIIFSLLFGYIINKERIRKSQIIFSIILLFGLTIAITQGSFNLLEFNFGVVVLLITAALWMLGHAITKTAFDKKEVTPTQLVFLRNTLSGIILISTYFLFFPFENIKMLSNPINIFYYGIMGVVYSFDLYCWYKVLTYLNVSKASVIASPTPIVTSFFVIFLGEIFTLFHLIGLTIVIISLYFIVREKKTEI